MQLQRVLASDAFLSDGGQNLAKTQDRAVCVCLLVSEAFSASKGFDCGLD